MKWVVTFAGSRDRYQFALALAEAGRLERLVTDFYTPKDEALGVLFRSLPRRARMMFDRRYAEGLSSQLVKWSPFGLWSDRLITQSQGDRDSRLGKAAGDLARRRGCGLLSYSTYGYAAFCAYGTNRRPKILYQMHPHPASVRRILSKELELSDVGGSSVLSEEEFCSSPERLEQLSKEALLADQCIVASSFTGQTLVENGVPKDRIHLVPLGVELGSYSDRPKEVGPFRVVFVGQIVQRKGLEYLLKAWKRLRLPNAELVLAGRGRVDRRLLAEFASEFKYVGELSNAELRELYITSDLFCMPSLVEGYGLVYLEALACGLPVIATRNTGAADMVQDGREGFIVPIQDVEALAEKLEWAYRNRAALTEMRTSARRLAEQYSWLRFRRELIGVIEEVESRHAVSSN